jgi:NitT/TauT family transport system ATP-binding protein
LAGDNVTLLRLEGFGHRYGAQRALCPLDLALNAGESVAVLGPSGCGKTTLLHAIAGLLEVTEGWIERRWQRLGVMFQQPRLLPWRSALDNLALGLKARGLSRASRRSIAHEFGTRLGLSAVQLAQYPATLSGGMQSRVALGRALVVQPQMLLLDEPFAALDVGLRHELGQLLLAETSRLQCGVMMITHEPREALRLADRLLVLGGQPGQLLLEFVPNRPAVERSEEEVLALESLLLGDAAFRAALGLPARSAYAKPHPAVVPIDVDSRVGCATPFSPHLSARHIAPMVRVAHGCQ